MPAITTFLWFDTQAEQAAELYVSLFANARITGTQRYGEAGPGAAGSVMTVSFELEGHPFVALNGGPVYRFTPAISLMVSCDSQEQVDHLWTGLGEGGVELQCGWLTDRFGVTWQIVPSVLPSLLGDPDPERAQRVMRAMLGMRRLDIAALTAARDGAPAT